MASLLTELRRTSPLPEGWALGDVVEDVVNADGLSLRRAGLAVVSPRGEQATGSAAETHDDPLRRSYFELLERASTLDAISRWPELFPQSALPDRWRYARSNGVAVHLDWSQACQRAYWELAERDRVLRAWIGEVSIEPVAAPGSFELDRAVSYRWRICRFVGSSRTAWSRDVEVIGVFGVPKRSGIPLVMGYGGRPTLDEAIDAATREATQMLAFLWGEEIPAETPCSGPTPVHHVDWWLWPGHHERLERWLDGGHRNFAGDQAGDHEHRDLAVHYTDLTPPWLTGGLKVAKAQCNVATPLAFGEAPLTAHLPLDLRIHPIA